MKYIKKFKIITLLFISIVLLLLSCERLDFKRIMDSKTDSVDVMGMTVLAHGSVLDVGETSIVEFGHCWSVNQNPTKDDFKTNLGTIEKPGTFTSELHSVIPGQKHYIRSYVFDGVSYVYGEESEFIVMAEDIQFTTSEIEEPDTIGNITVLSTSIGVGSVDFSEHGHCWSRTEPPTIADGRSSFGPYESDVSFSSKIKNLNLGAYYVRGYMESGGIVIYTNTVKYESRVSLETDPIMVSDIIYTNDPTTTIEGEIKSLGIKAIVDHGHCWSDTEDLPDINFPHTSYGPIGLGSFTSVFYRSSDVLWVRAYALDESGTSYYSHAVKYIRQP